MMLQESTTTDTLPLAGIRVLEFCHTIMGPSAGLILADLGADVIKIEPANGDPTRRRIGFAAGFFATFNRNKRSFAVDLKNEEGRALLYRLAAKADVVLENFAPGTMERLGCGYDDLSQRNPRLIYCALKGFLSGPYEHRPALDEVVQFMAGLAYMTGPPGQPLRAGSSVVDIMGGMFAVIGVQAALRERQRTGRGQMVKSALFESTAFPDDAAHGRRSGDRPTAAADAGARRRLGHL
jgi:crotonobetainyl-CoA:carnitine CoA-transferase CaiB-like acyl-CoA transferase